MQLLADKVWANPAFHDVAERLHQAWLAHDIGLVRDDQPAPEEVIRVVQAAAILACSKNPEHREKAYRSATSAFDLYGATEFPLDQATRVVLARLENFPAMHTRAAIRDALPGLPASLITEELVVADRRTITRRGQEIRLTGYQTRLWRRLDAGKRVAVAAPTSAGKSFVLQNFIAARLENPDALSIVYLVPTRALIAQVSADMRKLLTSGDALGGEVGIITVPIEAGAPIPRRAVYVFTQERLRMMLGAHSNFRAEIIIVDEAHSVGEGARGVLLQWTVDDLLQRNPSAQLLFASPNIRNLEVFGRIFGLTDILPLPSGDPTVAQNFLVAAFSEPQLGELSLNHLRFTHVHPDRHHGVFLDNQPVVTIGIVVQAGNAVHLLGNAENSGASNFITLRAPQRRDAKILLGFTTVSSERGLVSTRVVLIRDPQAKRDGVTRFAAAQFNADKARFKLSLLEAPGGLAADSSLLISDGPERRGE